MATERFHVSKAGDTHTHVHTHIHVHKRSLNYISRNDTSISVDITGYTDAIGIGRYQ